MDVIPSVCEQHPGMCCADPTCPDHACPAHPRPMWAQMHRIDRVQLGRPRPEPVKESEPEPGDLSLGTVLYVVAMAVALYAVWAVYH